MSSDATRAAAAECVLGLLTRRERAAAITGDLLEGSGSSSARFWGDLLSAGVGLIAGGLRDAPFRALWHATYGLVIWSSIYVSIRATAALAGLVAFDTRTADCCAAPPSTLTYFSVALILSNGLAGFLLGYRRRAAELNACVPLALVWSVAAIALPIADWAQLASSRYCVLIYLLAVPLLYLAPLLAGGALGNRARVAEDERSTRAAR